AEDRRRLLDHPEHGAYEHETRVIAHEVRAPAFLEAGLPPRLLGAARLVVQDAELGQVMDAPATSAGAVLVDSVPTHRRVQAADRIQAGAAVGLYRAVHALAADLIGHPLIAVGDHHRAAHESGGRDLVEDPHD